MKIKSLELVGFKSFVDRTVVHFDHDVLGIVGPNGCGKSNIVDAIRWCMGEQSAKHLRGRSMEDVIFNGSDSRPGSEFAEVTLTFENDRGDVPVEYKDYPEIAVTRRLHRNGDSDYLINKTHVRLKDITDLFLGTGAGTKAYAIVEQGKIGLIVSAKPEDRRMLIEEAAGITKFKSKKKQAEKKMELTQGNLTRLGDILAEIDRNMGTLKRQAAKAERFLAYRKELEDLQLYEASHKYLELTGWIKLESEEVSRFASEADEAKNALAARDAELETLRLDAHGAEERLEEAQTANFNADNEVRAEEAAIQRGQDKLEGLRRREEQARGELEQIEDQQARMAEEREETETEIEVIEREESVFSEQVESEEERLAELTDEMARADATVSELLRSRAQVQASVASLEAKLSGLERRRGDVLNRSERMRGERDELESLQLEHAVRTRELGQSVEDLRSGKVASQEEKIRLEALLKELREQVHGLEKSLDEAKSEFSKKRSRLQALQEVQRRLEGVGTGVKALMGTKDECIVGLVADRIEAPATYTVPLAALLGPRLQDVVVTDIERGLGLLQTLATGKKGRASILSRAPRAVPRAPLPALWDASGQPIVEAQGLVARLLDQLRVSEEDRALAESLVGDTLVVEDAGAALRVRELAQGVTLVTMDGTVFHADGRISGGQGEDMAAHMLDSKRETRELTEEVTRLETLVNERSAEYQAVREAVVQTQAGLDRARSQAHSDELALVTSEKDLQKAQAQWENVRQRLEVIAGEQEELSAQLQDVTIERDEARESLDQSREGMDDFDARLDDGQMRAASWKEQVEARRQVLTERKVRMAGAKERLAAARTTLQRLDRARADLAERGRRLSEEMASSSVAQDDILSECADHRAALDEALDTAREAAEKLTAARAAFDDLRAQLGEREGLLKDWRKRADDAREELTAHEMRFRERTMAMQHLLEGVAEKFRGLHLPRIVGDYHMRPPPDEETRNRIQELTHLLERMGSVNLDAMRELEETEKRQTFYTTQKADLDQALADLQRAIQQMNRESRRLFKETFEAVNAKFQELFPRMFRGGQASLRLTNPEDMLETGIDILAQPPGKKLSSIELMSGGEKALTAVALIFSIFQIKPSPFCILDEVDAPLDEANVARYNEAIRSMTDRSQFILITHIKRTMQMVDVLYGVTMPESGVSKLVSVKLNEAVDRRRPAAAVA
jgi:chromosome segregation protein